MANQVPKMLTVDVAATQGRLRRKSLETRPRETDLDREKRSIDKPSARITLARNGGREIGQVEVEGNRFLERARSDYARNRQICNPRTRRAQKSQLGVKTSIFEHKKRVDKPIAARRCDE
jgi:hypothetical protein